MTGLIVSVVSLALMGLGIVGALWYFKRIRDGRADPVVDPSWPTIMRPASPPPRRDDEWEL